MPQLDVATYLSQLFWLAVTFTFLYVLVKAVILPRLGEVLENRRRRIADDLEMAERLQRQAEETRKAHEALLADARAQAQALVHQQKEAVQAEIDDQRRRLEEELTAKIAAAEASLKQAKRQALGELEGTIGELAAEIAARISGRAPSEKALREALRQQREEG